MRYIIYLCLLLFPFLLIVLVNESQREQNNNFQINGVIAINSFEKLPYKCTWYCHKDTDYCIKNHNTFIKDDFLTFTNSIYNSIIAFLSAFKGGYQTMNVAFLVIGIPLLIWYLTVKAVEQILTLRKFKK